MNHLKPKEIYDATVNTAVTKINSSFMKLAILGIFAGAYIAFAAVASNMAAFNLLADPEKFGLGKLIQGAVFTAGLIMVVLAGAELFTGNTMIVSAVFEKKATIWGVLRNWLIVFVANFIGAMIVVLLVNYSGGFSAGNGLLGGMTIKIAAGKVNMTFIKAMFAGILCNWLVCLAVWMASGAPTTIGKIWAIFFPIMVFVTSGFEHSIANMYYIPAGILAAANETFAAASGVGAEALANLTWGGMLLNNLLPVTIGNIIGGAICLTGGYCLALREAKKKGDNK